MLYEVITLVLALLLGRGRGDVEDLATQRQDSLRLAQPRLLGRAAGAVALDQEQLRALARRRRAVRQLAGQAQLLGGGLAAGLLRITSYNVCYTKLLRRKSSINSSGLTPSRVVNRTSAGSQTIRHHTKETTLDN